MTWVSKGKINFSINIPVNGQIAEHTRRKSKLFSNQLVSNLETFPPLEMVDIRIGKYGVTNDWNNRIGETSVLTFGYYFP